MLAVHQGGCDGGQIKEYFLVTVLLILGGSIVLCWDRTMSRHMRRTNMNDTNKRHGLASGCYANREEGQRTMIECLCGWETDLCDDWETAGALLDDHLALVEGESDNV